MKAFAYYKRGNLWDAFEPFVEEAQQDRLELLHNIEALRHAARIALEARDAMADSIPTDLFSSMEPLRHALAALDGDA